MREQGSRTDFVSPASSLVGRYKTERGENAYIPLSRFSNDFVIHAQAPSLARIKVVVLRIVSSDDDVADGQSVYSDGDSGKHRPSSAPSPAACAKVTASGVVVINISSIQQL